MHIIFLSLSALPTGFDRVQLMLIISLVMHFLCWSSVSSDIRVLFEMSYCFLFSAEHHKHDIPPLSKRASSYLLTQILCAQTMRVCLRQSILLLDSQSVRRLWETENLRHFIRAAGSSAASAQVERLVACTSSSSSNKKSCNLNNNAPDYWHTAL